MSIDQHKEKLKKIKLLALDVDGIQTNAKVFWLKEQGWTREFSVRDGQGLLNLKKTGVIVAYITAGDTQDVRERAKRLKLEDAYFGTYEKLACLDEILEKYGYTYEQVAYMGDDLPDLPVLKKVGFSATVPEAIEEVVQVCDYVTHRHGGDGAVREVVDAIMRFQK